MNVKKYLDYVDRLSKCDDFSILDLANDDELPLQGRAFMCAVSLDSQAQLALSIWCARAACERSSNARIDRRVYASIEFKEAQLKKGELSTREKQQSFPQNMKHFDQTMTALRECVPAAINAVACSHWLCFTASRKMTIGCVSHFVATFEDENEGYQAILDKIKSEVK